MVGAEARVDGGQPLGGGGWLFAMFTMGIDPPNLAETDYVYGPDYVDEFAFFINANAGNYDSWTTWLNLSYTLK